MMAALHYLTHGTWLGILALILIVFGITQYSFATISIHRNSNFSGSDASLSHRLFGGAFVIAGILIIILALFFGNQPISSKEYSTMLTEVQQIPEIKPVLENYITAHPKMTHIDYHNWQVEFEQLKAQIYSKKLSS